MADDDVLAEFGLDDASSDKKFHDMGLGAFVSIDMQTLTEAWITEANCPEILKYKEDIVNTVQQSLTAQTELMEQELENMQEDGTQSIYFSVMLFQMDIERVRYNLARYLRTRILKIEKCMDSILSDPEALERLSSREKLFVITLSTFNKEYMKNLLENKLNEGAKKYYTTDDLVFHGTPNMKQYVYFRPKEDITLMTSSGRRDRMQAGNIGIAEYGGQIREYVLNDQVLLV